MKDEFYFETNEEFSKYVKTSSTQQLLKLYRYTQKIMSGKNISDAAGAMIDALVIYPILIERGYSRKDLINES